MKNRSIATKPTGTDEPLIKAEEILAKRFSAGFPGYRSEEVDLFLDRIILEFERRDALEKRLRERIRSLSEEKAADGQEPGPDSRVAPANAADRNGSSFLASEPLSGDRADPTPFRAKRIGTGRFPAAVFPDSLRNSPMPARSEQSEPDEDVSMDGPLERKPARRGIRIRNADLLFPDGGGSGAIGKRRRKQILSGEDRT